MLGIALIVVSLIGSALSAEIPSSYALREKIATFNSESKSGVAYKTETKAESEHPVYKPDEYRNEGRAKIEPVKPLGPVIKHDRMLADQPSEGTTEVNRIDNLAIPNYGYVPVPAEVAYPDVPYAPGYGYDAGYAASHGYDIYGNNSPSNYFIEPDTSTLGFLWNQVPDSRTIVSFVGRTIAWFFGSVFALFLGSILTVGVCSYTNLCTLTFNGVGPIHEEVRALISPERLEKISNAADFVKTAIDKYQKIQKVTEDIPGTRKRRDILH